MCRWSHLVLIGSNRPCPGLLPAVLPHRYPVGLRNSTCPTKGAEAERIALPARPGSLLRSFSRYFASGSLARNLSGFSVISPLHPEQHKKTSRSLTVTLYGLPMEPSASPLTGQVFCL